MTFCLFKPETELERVFFDFQEIKEQTSEEKFRSLLFFIAKNFHKVFGGFLFVMPNPLRVTTLDWFGIFCFPDTINLRMRGEKLVPVGREFKLVDFHDSLGHLLCLFLQRLYILKFEGICGIIYYVGQTDKSEFGGGVNEYSK